MKNNLSSLRPLMAVAIITGTMIGILPAGEPVAKGDETVNPASQVVRLESRIKKFEAADAATPPPEGAVLLVIDSIMQLWTDVGDYFPGHEIINRGIGGARLIDALNFVDRIVLPYKPSVIVISAGGNDLAVGTSPEQIGRMAQEFIAKIHATLPETRIYYLGLPLVRRATVDPRARALIEATNKQLKELASTEKTFEVIDLAPAFLNEEGEFQPDLFVEDGVHFSPKGYKVVAGLLGGKL